MLASTAIPHANRAGVTGHLLQLVQSGHAGRDQNDGRDRHLEGQSEGQEQGDHEIEVLADVGHHRHALGRHPREEAEHQRKNDEVSESAAGVEKENAGVATN